jgi:uncharacterized protein (TIGR03032 family)
MARAKKEINTGGRSTLPIKEELWSQHQDEWRDPCQITSQWKEASQIDPRLLQYKVTGKWWDVLASSKITLMVTREYEHLVMAMTIFEGKPMISFMPMPHPSGLVVDHKRGIVHIASTRNPNQIYDLMPTNGLLIRGDIKTTPLQGQYLIPVRSRFFPGCLYVHDLGIIGGQLYANAVGQNLVVKIKDCGRFEPAWWPKCVENKKGIIAHLNHLQLNSIAGGKSINSSFFTASTDQITKRRPGHKNFPVDKRGVVFSGKTGVAIARGLTRPHSARIHKKQIWVDNSGYGELGIVEDGCFAPILKLPGWTRGLCFHKNIAFVGTSKVIPRFRNYAPGLEVDQSVCGIHAVDTKTHRVLGSITWPYGNQIFSVDWTKSAFCKGFPFLNERKVEKEKSFFYSYKTSLQSKG